MILTSMCNTYSYIRICHSRLGNAYKTQNEAHKFDCLFVCLFRFYGTLAFVGYLMPNPFYGNKQFYFKQFSSA